MYTLVHCLHRCDQYIVQEQFLLFLVSTSFGIVAVPQLTHICCTSR